MKLFLDTEFTGLHKDTTIVSIGIVPDDEKAKKFYAEFIDYDKNQIDDWINKNVISNLILSEFSDSSIIKDNTFLVKGCKETVQYYLKAYFKHFDEIEIWSDCLAYDWVLFNDLFDNELPENINYIPFDICTLFKIKNIDPDVNREKFCEINSITKKHNALFDAEVIKKCYKKLMEKNKYE